MKIMIVNKYHYYRGGAETCAFKLGELLESENHDVLHFSMHHPENLEYKYDKFFVPYIDFAKELEQRSFRSKLKVANHMFYSKVAKRNFDRALEYFKPDIIHLHNIHRHITTSILDEARKRIIPVVWTLHDYQLICPSYTMLSHGKICERCKTNYLAPVFERCTKNSLPASIASNIERLVNDIMRTDKKISYYIGPSRFLIDKCIEFGMEKSKLVYINNFFDPSSEKRIRVKNKVRYFFYFGRLSSEKGIITLCEAAQKAGFTLKIAGDGPLKEILEKKYGSFHTSFLGYKTGNELESIRRNAWFTVLPSEWYENNPFSIIESFADGTPVIGSRIGGIPELIQDYKTGLLFSPGSIEELTRIIRIAENMTETERNLLGKNAQDYIKENYNSRKHYISTIKIYNKAISEAKK